MPANIADLSRPIQCSICQENLGSNADTHISMTPCGHFFCHPEILQWLAQPGARDTCPLCRQFSPEDNLVDVTDLMRRHYAATQIGDDAAREAALRAICEQGGQLMALHEVAGVHREPAAATQSKNFFQRVWSGFVTLLEKIWNCVKSIFAGIASCFTNCFDSCRFTCQAPRHHEPIDMIDTMWSE